MLQRLEPRDGWRHFLGEVGIIVLGVLIALGLGQLAQEWNDRRNMRSAETAIREEIADNLGRLGNRQKTQACIDRRLEEIAALLDAAEAGTMVAPRWIGRPQVWNMQTGNFQAATQSGRMSLLDGDTQSAYTAVYSGFAAIEESQREEGLRWARLRALEGRSSLDAALIDTMRTTLSEARFFNWRTKVSVVQNGQSVARIGIRPTTPGSAGSRSICLPMSTPRAEALRLTGSPYGEP